jgi:uncharacterized membrane protein YcfT
VSRTIEQIVDAGGNAYPLARALLAQSRMGLAQHQAAFVLVSAMAVRDAAAAHLDRIVSGALQLDAMGAEYDLDEAEDRLGEATNEFLRLCGSLTVEVDHANR